MHHVSQTACLLTDPASFVPLMVLAFIVGTVLGSFVTMASHRLPRSEDIVAKPSYCPTCTTPLTWKDLFPLFSWAYSRGKCRHCGSNISARYPLVELAMGLLCAGIFYLSGVTGTTPFLMVLATLLMVMIVTDLEAFIIPDGIQMALLVLGIAYDVYTKTPWLDVAESMGLGLGIGLALHYGYKWLRHKDGLGMGDVKFLVVAGAWLPVLSFVPFLFLSGIIGTCTGLAWRALGKGPVFPFGPALAISLFILVLFPGSWLTLLL